MLVGPDLRAGRFLACTVTLLGRLGDPPLPHSLARMRSLNTQALLKGAKEWIGQVARHKDYRNASVISSVTG